MHTERFDRVEAVCNLQTGGQTFEPQWYADEHRLVTGPSSDAQTEAAVKTAEYSEYTERECFTELSVHQAGDQLRLPNLLSFRRFVFRVLWRSRGLSRVCSVRLSQ